MDITKKEQELQEKYIEKKWRVRMNIIEMIVWLILLIFAFNYLKSHPAEKTSIFAGIEVMIDKVEVLISNLRWGNGEYTKNKQQMERMLGDLITTMKSGECLDANSITIAEKRLSDMQALSSSLYKERLQEFQWYVKDYAAKVQENCGE